jgi:predicted amidohydrolase YtcJ
VIRRTPGRLLVLAALMLSAPAAAGPIPADWVFRGGLVVDGTGAPGRRADVAVKDGRVVAIGAVEPGPDAKIIDASGLVVAPGFIDLHSHSDGSILGEKNRHNRNYLAQGVTTVVTGNCGSGPTDVGAFLAKIDRQGAGTNVIHLVPQGAVRREVLGTSPRRADSDALRRMERLVARGMEDGAWGMSSGLIYVPSQYADTAELIALARVVARHGGIYASHIRDEGEGLLGAIDEAIAIGKAAGCPVQVSHLKASGKANWGLIREACARIEAARAAGLAVTADQYPYVASSTSLAAMVVPDWAVRDGTEAFRRIAADPGRGPQLREAVARALERRDGGASIRIARYAATPSRVGKDLAAIAREEGTSALDVVLDIQAHGGAQAISFGMSEEDVRFALKKPYVATASDGSAHTPGGGDRPHPRAYGTFPRKFRYALDDGLLSLEEAVRSCSGLPAAILGLPDRGVLREGAVADLVVFDPKTFRDAATFDDPTRYAVGARFVLVNGKAAVAEGAPTGALAGRPLRRQRDGAADLILKAGRLWTGNPEAPWAEALAARGGEVVAVGSAAEVDRFRGPGTKVLDRPDGFALPGLIDAHGHMAQLGASLEQVDLRDLDLEAALGKIKAKLAATPGDGWILGANWDQSLYPGGAFPTAATLDAVAPDRPLWLTRVDGHAGWANSEAMRRAGFTREAKAPADGQIIVDGAGNPTGVLVDGAMGLIAKAVPPPTRADLQRQILAAQAACLKAGLTGVHDAGVSAAEAAVYRALDADGRLKMRVYGMASPPAGREVAFVSETPGPAGRRFTLRAIKLFMDGAMGSRGALLFEPYADDPRNTGLQLIDPEVLAATTTQALKSGWQVCTHAIGDKGNALVLDAYAKALAAVPDAKDARLRVEHAQVVRRADVPRFAALGAIASMQPAHAGTDKRWAEARLGPGRVEGAYAWSWFRDDGVKLAFGSDFPVEIERPFWGLYAAVTRQDPAGAPPGGWLPQHRLSLEDALRFHTAGGAYASFDEGRLGVLKVGMRADVTVLDRDPFRVAPRAIYDAVVTATVIDGAVVHEAAAASR